MHFYPSTEFSKELLISQMLWNKMYRHECGSVGRRNDGSVSCAARFRPRVSRAKK